ncbi:MAG: glucokinase, partial [Parasphingorhabdus sp.]
LTLGSKGGVYIAGGIVPRFKEDFVVSNFRSRFSDKGRYKHYNDSIATHLVIARLPAFIGLRAYLQGKVSAI